MARKLSVIMLAIALVSSTANAICGDGILDPGEACDDGNIASGDTCSSVCQFEGCVVTGTWRDTLSSNTWSLIEDESGTIVGVFFAPTYPAGAVALTGHRAGTVVTLDLAGEGELAFVMDYCDGMTFPDFSTLQLLRQRDSLCGDGVLYAEEVCDDGNFINGDSCTVACDPATCGNRIVEPGEECDDGDVIDGNGCSTTCEANVCGNLILEPGEECDDGNTINGDGCSRICRINVCGNGTIESGEECDDGNTVNGDACSSTCQFLGCSLTGTWGESFYGLTWSLIEDAEGGIDGVLWSGDPATALAVNGSRAGTAVSIDLEGTPFLTGFMVGCDDVSLQLVSGALLTMRLQRQRETVCGDGILDPGEACDDGNFVNGDDCTVACTTSVGCGNGTVDPGEECDDANGSANDACVPGCMLNVCGDAHVLVGTEACDDGNTVDGDGCASDCLTLDLETASGGVGGLTLTVTTDSEGDGATPSDPVETTVAAPSGTVSGTITITEQVVPATPPPGFIFMGTLVTVTATDLVPEPSAALPLALTFRLDATVIPQGQNEYSIEVQKDGSIVPDCTSPLDQAQPDPCVSVRERASDQDVVLRILTSTLSEWGFRGSMCSNSPEVACRHAATRGARLKLRSRGDEGVLAFRWKGHVTIPITLFGQPMDATDYSVCLYDSRGLMSQTVAPAGGLCAGRPCWSVTSRGYKYRDVLPDERMQRLLLKSGDAGRSKIVVKARTADMSLPMSGPVTLQVRSKDGACFGAIFGSSRRNDLGGYKAVSN